MELHNLKKASASTKKAKRKGRGHASTLGKTCGRGQKGQRARNTVAPGFEGGQTPLRRRLPRRGFNNTIFRTDYWIINLSTLKNAELSNKTTLTPQDLQEARAVRNLKRPIKVLATGNITKPITIEAHKFSRSAVEKIEAAGGKAIVIEKLAPEKMATGKLAPRKRVPKELATGKLATGKLAPKKRAIKKLATGKLATKKLATAKLATEKLATEKLATAKLVTEKLATEKN